MKNNRKQDGWDDRYDSLEELADGVSERLGCPVTIEDAGNRLLAYSTHSGSTDSARIATIISRRVPEQVIGSLSQEGIMSRLAQSDEPVRIPAIPSIGLGRRTAIAIRKNSTLLGYIWVLEESRTLDESGLASLKQAAGAAAGKLERHYTKKRKELERRQDFFWQLLTGESRPDERVRAEAEKLGVTLPGTYRIAIVQGATRLEEVLGKQLNEALPSLWKARAPLSASGGREWIWLLEETEQIRTAAAADATAACLRSLADRYGLQGGMSAALSTASSDYSQLGSGYREAQTVLQLKAGFPEQVGPLFAYDDLGHYRWLPYLAEQNRQARYTNPCLERLRAYDAEHHSSLLETLAVFLAKDCNGKEAAEALHLHANSLNYRLKRIAEIGRIRLDSMDQKVTLYLDLQAEAFLKRSK